MRANLLFKKSNFENLIQIEYYQTYKINYMSMIRMFLCQIKYAVFAHEDTNNFMFTKYILVKLMY